MNNKIKDIEKIISSNLTNSIKSSEIINEQIFIEVSLEKLFSTIVFLKTNAKCQFKQLIDIVGVDYPEKALRFKVVYLLLSHHHNVRIAIKTNIEEKQEVPSIVKIYPSANWMEREVFDMYGISFQDHPDLRRILTDYEFEGFPLRKDFPLTGHTEVRYNEDKKKVTYENVKLDQNYRDFDFESPWEGTKYISESIKNKENE